MATQTMDAKRSARLQRLVTLAMNGGIPQFEAFESFQYATLPEQRDVLKEIEQTSTLSPQQERFLYDLKGATVASIREFGEETIPLDDIDIVKPLLLELLELLERHQLFLVRINCDDQVQEDRGISERSAILIELLGQLCIEE